ncbi:hypothetical protein NDU88_011249 [Pleurodeles waltl]|uniref:Uncharacterized protein n=1 Tax=Pleurodeles waltl TaxID=8319 RepID=A0AAV7QWP2_PLEWA|nr:hypothetical protein NDU88_011249 [Pleurodeles waltl]
MNTGAVLSTREQRSALLPGKQASVVARRRRVRVGRRLRRLRSSSRARSRSETVAIYLHKINTFDLTALSSLTSFGDEDRGLQAQRAHAAVQERLQTTPSCSVLFVGSRIDVYLVLLKPPQTFPGTLGKAYHSTSGECTREQRSALLPREQTSMVARRRRVRDGRRLRRLRVEQPCPVAFGDRGFILT